MIFSIVVLRTNNKQFSKLVALGNRVIANMTGNGNFTTPVPALATVQTAVNEVEAAIAVWGPKGNRGSHADYVDLCQKAQTLHGLIKALASYVQDTAILAAGNDYTTLKSIIISSGLDVAKDKTPVGVLQAVKNFNIFISPSLARNKVKFRWVRPDNTSSARDVSNYVVRKGTTPVYQDSVPVANLTRTEFIDTNNTPGAVTWYYWIVPFNAYGEGVPSEMIGVTILAA